MPAYVIYEQNTGKILHVHREFLMDSEQPLELSDEDVLALIGDCVPSDCEVAVLATEDSLKPRRGYQYYVDITSGGLMHVRSSPEDGKEGAR